MEVLGPTVPEVVGAGGKGLFIVGYHQWKEREPGCRVSLPVVGRAHDRHPLLWVLGWRDLPPADKEPGDARSSSSIRAVAGPG